MNREIKFRVWDKELKGMISPDLFNDLLNGKEVAWSEAIPRKVPSKVTELPFIDIARGTSGTIRHIGEYKDIVETVRMKSYRGNPFTLHNTELMQYIGLKDKNGVEIYDEDIVVPQGGYEDGECDHPSTVNWNEYNLQWEALCRTCASGVPLSDFDLNQVIGNIYENPELLKSTPPNHTSEAINK